MFGITEVSIKVIPPVYHCTRVHQFPASLLVLGTSPIIIPRTRVYILIAVVPKHFCCVKAEGLEQPGSGNYISHEIRNSWIRPCTLSLRNFRPLDEGMRGLDCASPCFPIEYHHPVDRSSRGCRWKYPRTRVRELQRRAKWMDKDEVERTRDKTGELR